MSLGRRIYIDASVMPRRSERAFGEKGEMGKELIWIVGQPAETLFDSLTPTARNLLDFANLAEKLFKASDLEIAEAMEQLGTQPSNVERLRTILNELLDEP